MTDPTIWLTIAATCLIGLFITLQTALRAWRGWLEIRRLELESGSPGAGSRIELADLKERIRKLEAIAAGVDL